MCLMAFAWQTGEHLLTLLGNRDEFHARPSREAGFWEAEGLPDLLAGKDLEAGGTWLGVTRQGRFAALTNVRQPGSPVGTRSRGHLALDYLASDQSPEAYLQRIAAEGHLYSGFNLLVGDCQQLWHLNSQEARPQHLSPGIYGLSNASLDSPWPKLLDLRNALAAHLNDDPASLLDLLGNTDTYTDERLPATGVSLEWERLLSARFILGDTYGTRASSLLRLSKDEITFTERCFGPNGTALGENCWLLELNQRP